MKLYSIFDKIKNEFSPPIMCITDGQAWREFDQFIAKDQYAVTHQDEFDLYSIADYDTQTGELFSTRAELLIKNLDTEDLIPDKEYNIG